MMDDLNMKLLKQHIAILQTHMESVNRLTESLATDADMLEKDMCTEDPETNEALEQAARSQEQARIAEAKLSKAIADLHFVMAGGDPCKVCTVKCSFGEGNCKPVWRGEEAGQ